jgi:hypothetical protein
LGRYTTVAGNVLVLFTNGVERDPRPSFSLEADKVVVF